MCMPERLHMHGVINCTAKTYYPQKYYHTSFLFARFSFSNVKNASFRKIIPLL